MDITLQQEEQYLFVTSPYWQVTHDLRAGGTVSSIRISHASNRNLLRKAVSACVDNWHESAETSPAVKVKRSKNHLLIEFSGRLTNQTGKPGPIRYVHRYLYSLYSIQNELTLLPLRKLSVRSIITSSYLLDRSLNEYSWGSTDYELIKPRHLNLFGPHYDDIFGRLAGQKKTVFESQKRPWQITVFRRGSEGICWTGDSKQFTWEKPLGTETNSKFSLRDSANGPEIILAPLQQKPNARPANLDKELCLKWYLILPNVRNKERPKYYEVVCGTCPFPSESHIAALASTGVNLIRIHDDVDNRGWTKNNWHDGSFPPFDPPKMKELLRFIRCCHKHHIKVIPYFSGWELYPTTPAFKKYAGKWYSPSHPNGQIRFTPSPKAGVYGALMCPDSGWGKFLERLIIRTVDEFGFDGYYLDWPSPWPCFNYDHFPGEHNGVDALLGMLERTRQWLGDRLLVIHACGMCGWLMHHNIADQIVTLEEGKKNLGDFESLDDYPGSIRLMGSASVSLVPGLFDRSPKGKSPRYGFQKGLAHAVLLNALPYSYLFRETNSLGESFKHNYKNWRSAITDKRGLYAAYRAFSKYDFTKYRFYDSNSGVAQSRKKRLGAATFIGDYDAILVVSNLGEKPISSSVVNLHWPNSNKVKKINVPPLDGFEFRLKKISR